MIPFLKSRKKIQVYRLQVKMYILISFFVVCRFTTIHGSRIFRQGGSRLSRQKKTFDNVFIIFYLTLVLNLFSVILSFFFKGKL